MKTFCRERAGLTVLLVAVLATGSAQAQETGDFPFDRFSFTVGSFYERTDTKLRLDAGTANAGSLINLERDLGLPDSDQLLRIGLEWRPFERSQFSAGYYKLSSDGRRSIDREIRFGETVFPVNASIETAADFQFTELLYTFWAVKKPRGGLGLSLGASVISIEASLQAQLALPNGTGTARLEREASTDLPVPVIGVEGRYAVTPRILIGGDVRALPSVQIGDYKGDVLLYGARLEYRPFRHFGLGASWNSFDINADVEKERFRGKLDFTVEGAQAFVRVVL